MSKLAFEYLLGQRWALDANVLRLMADIASRGSTDIDLSALKEGFGEVSRQAVAARKGQAVTQRLEVRDGVGVLHISGIISRYASLFEDACGGASVETLAKEYNAALENPAIHTLVAVFDTPGGDPSGVYEFAAMIRSNQSGKRQVAYVGDLCASAGYWLAVAFDEVVISPTASLGSIGVVATLEKRATEEGVTRYEYVSSQSPKKRLDPTSEEGRTQLLADLDQLADLFIDQVAEYRAVARETVLESFGQGATLMGEKAVSAGMADRLGSFEALIAELSGVDGMAGGTKVTALTAPVAVAGAVTALKALDPEVVVAALDQLPDMKSHIGAALGPDAPLMALQATQEVLAACTDAGFPQMAATLLVDGMTQEAALTQIKQASGLKDVLVAAGVGDSMPDLLAHVNDPVKLAGQLVNELKAEEDENSRVNGQLVPDGKKAAEDEETKSALNPDSVYQARRQR
ncbi:S49 family peptidase [Pontibacterium sp.]|uniref:S49 family peptidase n=1 Tax=Pontibacterium sp. TaxID=2036026 RepID=UPI003568B238